MSEKVATVGRGQPLLKATAQMASNNSSSSRRLGSARALQTGGKQQAVSSEENVGRRIGRAGRGQQLKQQAGKQQAAGDTWNSLDDLFWEHMREVQNKWQTLKMNDDIWAKLIYFEQNQRLAKAYVSTPVLTIDGSTSGLDGFRIGLSGIENSHRSLEAISSLRSIGQGIKLKIDSEGNILVHRIGLQAANSAPSCSIWVKEWPPADADFHLCPSPLSSSSLSDSYTSAGSSSSSSTSSSSLSSSSPAYLENWNIKKLSDKAQQQQQLAEENSLASYKLFDMKKFRAKLERQRRQQYSAMGDTEQVQLVDWRQCVSIVCFVRNNISQQVNGPQLTKQLIAEDKLNRDPRRILKEPCWLMLINIIAIDMLKSLLCDNKSNIRPMLPMAIQQQQSHKNWPARNKIGATSKQYKTAQQSYERANSRILEYNEEEDVEDDGYSRSNHHQSSTNINISSNYENQFENYQTNSKNLKSNVKQTPASRLKSSSSVASLHPSGGEKLISTSSSSSSGRSQLVDYSLFPTGNIINYFANKRKQQSKTSLSFNGNRTSSNNLISSHASRQTTGGLLVTRNGQGNLNDLINKRTIGQKHVDQIYSKSDYIKFDNCNRTRNSRSSSQQFLNHDNSNYTSSDRYNYSYNNLDNDDDAIYTTFTGKYLYNNANSNGGLPNEMIYSTANPNVSDNYKTYKKTPINENSVAKSNDSDRKCHLASSLYPINSLQTATQLSQLKKKSATLGQQQSRSSFDLSHRHQFDLHYLKTPNSIKINFDNKDESSRVRPVKQSNGGLRAITAFNKKASEWSRLAKRFASTSKSSLNRIPSPPYSETIESKYKKKQNIDANRTDGQLQNDELDNKITQEKISRSSIVSSSSSSGCLVNDYFLSQSSMSSASSAERTTNDGGDSNQPVSSSGIVCSGHSSDDCGATTREGSERSGQGVENDDSNKLDHMAKKPLTDDTISRRSTNSSVQTKRRFRSISKNRRNVKKLPDEPECGHYKARLECYCQDCGHQKQQQQKMRHIIGDVGFANCNCCCDCFLDEPPLLLKPIEHKFKEKKAPAGHTTAN